MEQQPTDPMTSAHQAEEGGDAAVSGLAMPTGATSIRPRRRASRQLLLVLLSVLALLGIGGGAAAVVFYDKATKPDLRTPVLVALEYLRAYLVDRDDGRAAQYQCRDTSGLRNIRALRDDIDAREKTYSVTIAVSIDSVIETSRTGDTARLVTDLVLSTTDAGGQLRRVQHWELTTRNESGWRACSGHEVT